MWLNMSSSDHHYTPSMAYRSTPMCIAQPAVYIRTCVRKGTSATSTSPCTRTNRRLQFTDTEANLGLRCYKKTSQSDLFA